MTIISFDLATSLWDPRVHGVQTSTQLRLVKKGRGGGRHCGQFDVVSKKISDIGYDWIGFN